MTVQIFKCRAVCIFSSENSMNSENLFQAGASSVQVDVVLHGKYMLFIKWYCGTDSKS